MHFVAFGARKHACSRVRILCVSRLRTPFRAIAGSLPVTERRGPVLASRRQLTVQVPNERKSCIQYWLSALGSANA
jgi:hypothetical protein